MARHWTASVCVCTYKSESVRQADAREGIALEQIAFCQHIASASLYSSGWGGTSQAITAPQFCLTLLAWPAQPIGLLHNTLLYTMLYQA